MGCELQIVIFENDGSNQIINNNEVNTILVLNRRINRLVDSILNLIDN